jgi:hypothetical protein
VGLQKMPVVLTPTKNNPSKELSLLSSASYKTSGDGNEAAIIAIQISARVDTIRIEATDFEQPILVKKIRKFLCFNYSQLRIIQHDLLIPVVLEFDGGR